MSQLCSMLLKGMVEKSLLSKDEHLNPDKATYVSLNLGTRAQNTKIKKNFSVATRYFFTTRSAIMPPYLSRREFFLSLDKHVGRCPEKKGEAEDKN